MSQFNVFTTPPQYTYYNISTVHYCYYPQLVSVFSVLWISKFFSPCLALVSASGLIADGSESGIITVYYLSSWVLPFIQRTSLAWEH